MNMSGHPNQQQQFFAEYSLWNDSTYCSRASINPIHFTRPVFEESIFLSPPSFEQKAITDGSESKQPEPKSSGNPWFESYLRKSLRVVKREDLLKNPDLFNEDDDLPPKSDEAGSSFWTQSTQTASTSQLVANRNGRRVNNRGRKNAMQQRLEKALQQPVRSDKGASMMQRMGWEGGALGRDGVGIIDPIAPNAQYAYSTSGFGAEDTEELPEIEPIAPPPKRPKTNKKPKILKEYYKTNVLLHILEFVKNDLQIELCFESNLNNGERKRIHQLVAALNGDESGEDCDTVQQYDIVRDIHKRNAYVLGTHSDGVHPNRQICIYKEAPDYMYLVTPDDIRNPQKNEEEETNPFLKSITKHMKSDTKETVDNPPTIFDRLIKYFIEFATDEYTEFRFLGPFLMEEITVMNSFLGLISCLAKNEPCVDCPEMLLKVFEKGVKYSVDEDCNGYVSIKKLPEGMDVEIESVT